MAMKIREREFLFLVKQNIKHQRVKYFYIFAISFIAGLFILASRAVSSSIQKGIDTARDRFGADMVVVARDEGVDFEEVLYDGKPVTSRIDGVNIEDIENIPWITRTASRLYMASLEGMSCCDNKVQLIATDKNDYLLKSWVGDLSKLRKDVVIVGSRLGYKEGDVAKFFGREFAVIKVIEKTGTGADLSVFISRETAADIINDERYADLFAGYSAEDNSAIFISSNNPKVTENALKSRFGNKIDVFVADKRVSEYTSRVSAVKAVLGIAVTVITALSILSILAVTSVQTAFRGREAGVYLIARKDKVYIAVLWSVELLVVTVAATVGSCVIFLWLSSVFKNAIEIWLKSPLDISAGTGLATVLVMVGSEIILSVIAILSGSSQILRKSAGELIKEKN